MNIIELCRETAKEFPNEDPRKLAKNLYSKVTKEGIIELLTETIEDYQRGEIREIERKVFLKNRFDSRPITIEKDDNFRKLLDSKIKIGDGNSVKWGNATLQEHQERINYLKKMRDGIDETITFHEKAIEIISSNKVKCLNDIPEKRLQALI